MLKLTVKNQFKEIGHWSQKGGLPVKVLYLCIISWCVLECDSDILLYVSVFAVFISLTPWPHPVS